MRGLYISHSERKINLRGEVIAALKAYEHIGHTLTLYSFIEQYLLTLSVAGSQVSLNKQFDDYFNPVLTSANEDIHPLLDRINGVIQDNEFDTFFVEVRKSCDKHACFTTRFHDFMHNVLEGCPRRVKDAAVRYIQSDEDYRNEYLEKYPKDVLTVLAGNENIHQFWYSNLPNLRKKLTILALMLEADMIPQADRVDAMRRCLKNAEEYTSKTDYSGLSQEMIKTLVQNSFFSLFYDMYFNAEHTSHNAGSICYKTDFYMGVIGLIPWDKRYVEQLMGVVNAEYVPYTLRDRLRDKYQQDAEYKTVIDGICAAEGLSVAM